MKSASTAETAAQDAFDPAMGQAEMMRYLESGAAFAANHSEVERFAERAGREFMRRMLQGQFKLRALREPTASYARSSGQAPVRCSRSLDLSTCRVSRSRRARWMGFIRWTPC